MGKRDDQSRREAEGKETLNRVLKGLRDKAGDDTEARVREAKRIADDERRRGIGRKRS